MTPIRLDHWVLTVADIEASLAFYTRVLGMTAVTFGEGRRALAFGEQKINLHPAQQPLKPHARVPTPGTADLCFLVAEPMEEILAHLSLMDILVELGPVKRTGALGPIWSVYFRDPDGNLLEVAQRSEKCY